MSVNVQELSTLLQEAGALSNKPNWTKADERRNAFLLSAISAVKSGASLRDLELDYDNERRRQHGVKEHTVAMTVAEELQARSFKAAFESRGMVEGETKTQLGTYSGLGFFVPTGLWSNLFSALAARDILFDEADCTVLRTSNGAPIAVPVLGDIEVVASVAGEGSSRSESAISSTDHAKLNTYTYDSKRWVVSLESVQDLVGALSVSNLANSVFASRLARGISRDLLTGDGVNRPTGLLTALDNIGVTPVSAQGSVVNDGNAAHTGVTTLGSDDFAAAIAALDSAYLESPKACWAMNRRTLATVANIKSSTGQPIGLVQYAGKKPTIMGLPVKISPSIDDLGASKTPVILGDFSFWCTRLVTADETDGIGLYTYREADSLIENGNVGLACFSRAGGTLLYSDTGSPAPFITIRNHS